MYMLLCHLCPRSKGCASSTILCDGFAFLADSLTANASGLNCKWSMDSRMIGLAKVCVLSEAVTRRVPLFIAHSTSLQGKYPSTVCFGFASAWTLADATARLLAEDTRHADSLTCPSSRVLGRESCSTRVELTARLAVLLTGQGTSRSGWYWGWAFFGRDSRNVYSRSSAVLAASLTLQIGELLPQLKM